APPLSRSASRDRQAGKNAAPLEPCRDALIVRRRRRAAATRTSCLVAEAALAANTSRRRIVRNLHRVRNGFLEARLAAACPVLDKRFVAQHTSGVCDETGMFDSLPRTATGADCIASILCSCPESYGPIVLPTRAEHSSYGVERCENQWQFTHF